MAPPIFPALPGIAYPLPRTTIWGDQPEAVSVTGKRSRTSYRTYPTYGFEVSFGHSDGGFLRSGPAFLEWQQLQGFLNSLRGGVGLFYYTYPDDSVATAQVFGTGDGASTAFQLTRTLGGFTEPVFAPVITQIRLNGVATGGFTVDNFGKVMFGAAPGGGVSIDWTGTFYWPCRFDDKSFAFSTSYINIYEIKSLRFSSEKLP